jgi:tRNA pseudouridine55 synthase
VPLERLETAPPPLLDPLLALGHLPRQQLSSEQLVPWRCGRSFAAKEVHGIDQPVAVIGPDGILAGIARADGARADGARADGARADGARADGAGLLRPKLVFDAAG